MFHSKGLAVLAAASLLLLGGCSYHFGSDRQALQRDLSPSGFSQQWLTMGGAAVLTATRPGTGQTFLVIEGDGAAYDAFGTATSDPTPLEPVAANIATAIAQRYPNAKVIYAARPCQYLDPATTAQCPSRLWRMERFGQTAQSFYQYLIGEDRPIIIGYSGGGVIATHLAAQGRAKALVTVASPLALNKWAMMHNLTGFPLRDDPMMVRSHIAVNQLHIAGARDATVPPTIGRTFGRNMWVIENYRHDSDWRQPVLQAIKDLDHAL